ncbi:MAG: 50S ribosomal protein L22 [bacterium]
MEVKAHISNARMTPRKVRGLREVVVGLPVREALGQLDWQGGKAAKVIGKVLRSAVANAQHNHELEEDNLQVAELKVNDGMRLKRWRPASRGMAHAFVKRACHITVVLEEIVASGEKRKKPKARQADIDTLTVDELAQREQVDKSVEDAAVTGRAAVPTTSGVFQKIKMQQQGGEKKKTHRRKSI